MSAVCENAPEDLAPLVGATILAAKITEEDDGFGGMDEVVQLHVRYRDGLVVNDAREGLFQIWQDPEGNGPGFIAYVGDAQGVADTPDADEA